MQYNYKSQVIEATQLPSIDKLWYIYTVEYYSAIKKKMLPFAEAGMDLGNIMVNEINQSEKDKYHIISPLSGI